MFLCSRLIYLCAIGALLALWVLTILLFVVDYYFSYSKSVRGWDHFVWCLLDNNMVCLTSTVLLVGSLLCVINLVVGLLVY